MILAMGLSPEESRRFLASLREPFSLVIPSAIEDWIEHLGERLVSLVLFGSVARGQVRETSDVDLLAVAKTMPRSLADRRQVFLDRWHRLRSERGLPWVEWNLIVKTPEEAVYRSPLYLDMVTDARFLFDRDGFFEHVLDGMRERMRELGSRKVTLPDGTWYWDLKPDYRFGESVEI